MDHKVDNNTLEMYNEETIQIRFRLTKTGVAGLCKLLINVLRHEERRVEVDVYHRGVSRNF